MEQQIIVGTMTELIEYLKPIRMRQLKESYWFTIGRNRVVKVDLSLDEDGKVEKDDEGNNLYRTMV